MCCSWSIVANYGYWRLRAKIRRMVRGIRLEIPGLQKRLSMYMQRNSFGAQEIQESYTSADFKFKHRRKRKCSEMKKTWVKIIQCVEEVEVCFDGWGCKILCWRVLVDVVNDLSCTNAWLQKIAKVAPQVTEWIVWKRIPRRTGAMMRIIDVAPMESWEIYVKWALRCKLKS